MWHKPCRTFNPWCLCIKTRCLFYGYITRDVRRFRKMTVNRNPNWQHTQGPSSHTVFLAQFKFNGNFVSGSPRIGTKCCSWHESYAVVACAKFCCDFVSSRGMTVMWTCRRIWITGENMSAKRIKNSYREISRNLQHRDYGLEFAYRFEIKHMPL